ncbi:ATP synthase subunit I [uncultured Thiohalocapsa sp.]|jgi:F1F0 ATPase subunit 2|uniref:ATP synthase subunit I n=1 Tax=uncultured Thiohalocapsa sp. TaxID=768990 RepID=UPI0025DE4BE2|nr:ATP synthase subunit I [uncultured Thiohalocapsa sp.]
MSGDTLITAALVVAAFGAGAGLGWLFYAGLYRTVQALARTRQPVLLIGGSLLLRMLVLLAGLWVLMLAGQHWTGDGWTTLVPGLLGVIAVRALLLRRYGRPGDRPREQPDSNGAGGLPDDDTTERQSR